jgi:hypothetical protein
MVGFGGGRVHVYREEVLVQTFKKLIDLYFVLSNDIF